MDKKIDDISFIIFDVETTGLEPKSGDRIIEIAALRYKGNKACDSFSCLVNPQRKISPAAFAVNHISQEMLDNAPLANEVLPRFMEYIGADTCLAGYNVGFDIGFLENELQLLGRSLSSDTAVVDIIRMARRVIRNADSYSLANISKQLGIKAPQEHRALSDVELTAGVFGYLVSQLKAKGLDSFMAFYNLFGTNLRITEEINNQRIAAIQRAMDLGVRLKIKYCSGSGAEITEREVDPKEIRQEGKFRYLVGYCHLRKDERTFKINAILNVKIV